MSLSIAFLLALMLPAQNSSQGVPGTHGFGVTGWETQDQYQLGSGPAPLYQSLQRQDQQQSKPLFVRPLAQNQSQSSDWLGGVPRFQGSLGQLQTRRFDAEDFLADQNSHMCFAIRSYIFKRNDGKAPVLVKTMTCTPNTVFLKKAGPPPKGLYVPLKLDY